MSSSSPLPFPPMSSPDSSETSSPEQNIRLQPELYQSPSQASSSETTTATGSGSSAHSTSGDSVTLSLGAHAKQLSQQGLTATEIAEALGTTIAAINSILDIQPISPDTKSSTSTPVTTSKIQL